MGTCRAVSVASLPELNHDQSANHNPMVKKHQYIFVQMHLIVQIEILLGGLFKKLDLTEFETEKSDCRF